MYQATRPILAAIAVALAAAAGSSVSAPDEFAWPVALDPGVSSNFCDYRDGRYHAGIDVRTYGREGIPCLAVADGWVSRIRASSRGYGKALHVMLDSGVQVVYAHLAEFVPALEDTLWAEQVRAGRYAVDVTVPKGRFPVRRGDVLAYSGATGATAPHLHFEVRTPEDEPLNPLAHGLRLPDRDRPTIPRIAFVPLSVDATVEGSGFPLELEPRRVAQGRYQIDDTLRFFGDVGVAASVVDRLNGRSGRLAPYELQVWADGTQLSRVTFERFRFDEVKHVDLALDMGALRARGTDVYTLYQRPGDPRLRAEFLRAGRVSPAPSTRRMHEGRLVAWDAAGNRSEVAFHYTDSVVVTVDGRDGRPRLPGERWRQSHLAVDLGGAFFHNDYAVVPVRDPRHFLTQRGHRDEHVVHEDTVLLRARELVGRTRPIARADAADTATVWFSAVPAGEAGRVSFASLGVELEYPADAVYADAVVFARADGDADAGRQRSLRRRSHAVRLGPAGWVLRKNATLRFPVAAPGPRDGVFRSGENGGSWSYL
ncbi:MAG TPA: M23 family metallopeptidase, partial [Candidatus Krumholzibacteria bacterium]|nr:M23 family metallopeptidase [Candidatus Krumholzibacteria bacterium]